MSRLFMCLAGLALLSISCAVAPVVTEFDDAAVLSHDYDDVWTALIETFADHNWAISTVEKDSGLIVTDWLTIEMSESSKYADCGKDWAGVQIPTKNAKFNVFAKTVSGGTSVRVTCSFRGIPIGEAGVVDCNSRGVIEGMVISELQSKLGETP